VGCLAILWRRFSSPSVACPNAPHYSQMRAYDRARMTLHTGGNVAPLSQDASRASESREGTKGELLEVVEAFPTSTFERVKYGKVRQ